MIAPGATIGILGGGQLGKMLAVPARQLGYGIAVLAPEGDAPAAGLADHPIRASFEDVDAARELASYCDVVTYEFENVPATTVRTVEARVPVRPSAEVMAITQDRLSEHAFLHKLGIPTAPGVPVHSRSDLLAGMARLGFPLRLKSARGGYDGGNQWRLTHMGDADDILVEGREMLLEAEVPFDREISAIVCRDPQGHIEVFPLFENLHQHGILALTRAPARISAAVARQATDIARTLAEAMHLIGTLTVEMFVCGETVRVNELAPRVHNSGHLTIEACNVSQFAQHIRAVCGLPLIMPELHTPAAMANLLGTGEPRRARLLHTEAVLARPDVQLHLYGKRQVRARRKMGHVTATAPDPDAAVALALWAQETLEFG